MSAKPSRKFGQETLHEPHCLKALCWHCPISKTLAAGGTVPPAWEGLNLKSQRTPGEPHSGASQAPIEDLAGRLSAAQAIRSWPPTSATCLDSRESPQPWRAKSFRLRPVPRPPGGIPSPAGEATTRVLAGFRRAGRARGRGPAAGLVRWEQADAAAALDQFQRCGALYRAARRVLLLEIASDALLRVSEVASARVPPTFNPSEFDRHRVRATQDRPGRGLRRWPTSWPRPP